MDQKRLDKEQEIYAQITKLREGNINDKMLAFECIGILGNESTKEKFENRLNIVESIIKKHQKQEK